MRDNYLAIKFPIGTNAQWFKKLRKELHYSGKQFNWQRKGTFHQTLVFIKDDTFVKALKEEFSQMVKKHKPFTQTIDKLDAFTTSGKKKEHIVCLTYKISSEMLALADDARALVRNKGVNSDDREFKPHITLVRIPADAITMSDLQAKLSEITLPQFCCQLNNIEYRYKKEPGHRGKLLIGKWNL